MNQDTLNEGAIKKLKEKEKKRIQEIRTVSAGTGENRDRTGKEYE